MASVRVNITMPDSFLKEVDRVSKLRGVTRSRFIQIACAHYINRFFEGKQEKANVGTGSNGENEDR